MTSAETEKARKLFAQSCNCVLAAAEPLQFPDGALPEVAFIGRSNAGKSSLINALTGRKDLARASKTPGRTQQIVFFNLADRLMIADLPGYGHAKAPCVSTNRWNKLVQTYLRKREALCCVFLLLDGSHEAKDNDIEMMEFLDRAAVVYKIVLTKMDRVRSSEERGKRLQEMHKIVAAHPAALSDIIVTSSENKTGIAELRTFLATYVKS
ncbi:MAG: ribosome biogenesis GTP-binding protein YihA/YsxC [Bdellovibrionales bacterium]